MVEVERSPNYKPIDPGAALWLATWWCGRRSAEELTDEKRPAVSASPLPVKRKQVRAQAEYSTNIVRPYSQYCNTVFEIKKPQKIFLKKRYFFKSFVIVYLCCSMCFKFKLGCLAVTVR
jgi:hypothetical protein